MKKRIGKSKFGILNCLALVLVTAGNSECSMHLVFSPAGISKRSKCVEKALQ